MSFARTGAKPARVVGAAPFRHLFDPGDGLDRPEEDESRLSRGLVRQSTLTSHERRS